MVYLTSLLFYRFIPEVACWIFSGRLNVCLVPMSRAPIRAPIRAPFRAPLIQPFEATSPLFHRLVPFCHWSGWPPHTTRGSLTCTCQLIQDCASAAMWVGEAKG